MIPATRHIDWLHRGCWLMILIAAAVVSLWFFRYNEVTRSRKAATGELETPVVSWPQAVKVSASECAVFTITQNSSVSANSGGIAKLFRLAGTFFAYGGAQDTRKAILADMKTGAEKIVGEGEEAVEGIHVVRIYGERVVFRSAGGEEDLWLSFSGSKEKAQESPTAISGPERFGGRRVGENSWVFSRNSLVDYYEEVRNDPQRLLAVFDSMKPIYQENGKIEGYRLKVEGEKEFFESVGMKEGDVVRKVNSMAMTSRHRAEYFIREFAADRANVFMIEIDRDGTPQNLTYQVRK